MGSRFISGFGGQVDFIRGSAIGDDGLGKPIIALPSVTKKGQSKIVPFINEVWYTYFIGENGANFFCSLSDKNR